MANSKILLSSQCVLSDKMLVPKVLRDNELQQAWFCFLHLAMLQTCVTWFYFGHFEMFSN